ncbi:MAG: hypothetical protein HY682_08800, partial [Chloroflexi bacterium]|nr:hypothetical protein [Chloroflexota bacterium]
MSEDSGQSAGYHAHSGDGRNGGVAVLEPLLESRTEGPELNRLADFLALSKPVDGAICNYDSA